jgi:2-oxoglutarate ferredoxin oxidoreductase subunit delta
VGRVVIDEQKCKACLICIDNCPQKMLGQSKNMNKSGYYPVVFLAEKGQCKGCALCAVVCPEIAIKEVYR